jgi:SAM-dependent methyltransferase
VNDLLSGERQVSETLDGIRADHRARYEWAAERLAMKHVVDAACGVGYGAKILAGAGCQVRAFDRSGDAVEFARTHYNHDQRISYAVGALEDVEFPKSYDAVICFEALEHTDKPDQVLKNFRGMAPWLYVSVPNEDVFRYTGQEHHFRHYSAGQLETLLNRNGWEVREWWGQEGPESPVSERTNGRTLVAVCERVEVAEGGTARHLPPPIKTVPQSVAIVAMGASALTYVSLCSQAGDRHRLADETWVVNAMAGVLAHDRVFHMDDMRLQEMRAAVNPKGNVAGLANWLRTHPGPIYTSRAYPEFPGAVEFPLAEVMTKTGHGYFNSTVAYAIAYALHLKLTQGGPRRLELYGIDFSYPNGHKREKGRACVEFWLGLCSAHGIDFMIARDSTLMDASVPEAEKMYGYDGYELAIDMKEDGFHVTKTDKPLPSVEEIERRYSHDPARDGAAT